MALDDYEFRPITFQGVVFPATLMGISILDPVLHITDDELSDWVWKLSTCRGVEKRAPADSCARLSQRMVDLLLEQRKEVLAGIRERLGPQGFDADTTFRDWIMAFQRIASLAAEAKNDCVWSSPSHPKDIKPANWQFGH